MNTLVIVIVIIVLLVAVVAAAFAYQRRRSSQLENRFGPEYDRTLQQTDDRRSGERLLREREQRRSQFEVTPLSAEHAARYREEWMGIQGSFVDQPAEAVQQSDKLVVRMMRDAGYPVDDFDHRVDDISVDHPDVAQHYRDAHAVAVAQLQGTADTEQLRQAVTLYRELVEALLRDNDAHDAGSSQRSPNTREQR
jgi:FtsZ-interacting cell division protein ZipA